MKRKKTSQNPGGAPVAAQPSSNGCKTAANGCETATCEAVANVTAANEGSGETIADENTRETMAVMETGGTMVDENAGEAPANEDAGSKATLNESAANEIAGNTITATSNCETKPVDSQTDGSETRLPDREPETTDNQLATEEDTSKKAPVMSETPEDTGHGKESRTPPLSTLSTKLKSWGKEMTEKEREGIANLLGTLLSEYEKGELSGKTLQSLSHAVNYERDVHEAQRQGEIKGRNLKIEEYLIEHRSAEGVRQLGCSSVASRPAPPPSVIGGLSAADRKSIWERGNEKRVSYR